MNLEDWWNKLHHNWKKNILINLDFPIQDLRQFKSLDLEIWTSAAYDAYLKKFKIGIRKRLDAFKASENELFDILNIDHFIMRHSGLKDLTPIGILSGIRFLSLNTGFTEDLNEIQSLKKLEYINVSCWNLQELSSNLIFDKLKEIKFVYCYKLKNLNMLSSFSQLETIDISWNAQIFDLSHLSNLEYLKKLIIERTK
jgi:hypothetical protein